MNQNIRQILREMIVQWQKQVLPEIKPRNFSLEGWFNPGTNPILCVVGFRRVGKTFALFDFVQKTGRENCLYLNLEDERLPKVTKTLTELINVIKEFYGDKRLVLLLDEIQEIPDWSRWARRVNESRLHHLILSGSSSKLSSAEIPTELRGRTITQTLFPLSFAEFKSWKEPSDELNLLREYLVYGGFPEIVLAPEAKKTLYIEEYFQTFLTRDIIERYHPRQKTAISDLIRLLLTGSYYTIGKLTKSLQAADYRIGKGTVANYLSYLKSSYFLKPVEIFSPRVKNRLQHPKKTYFADSFFVSRMAGNFSQNLGRLMEEVVAGQLFRRQTRDFNFEFYYWQDLQHNEVDFVLRQGLKTTEIMQVTYASSLLDLREREVSNLIKAAKQLKCENLTLITWDYKGEIKEKGFKINCVPLFDTLLFT